MQARLTDFRDLTASEITGFDCTNKKWCTSKHTGLLNSCLGKLCLLPYLVVPLISARITLISTRVSAHCHAILLCGLSRHGLFLNTMRPRQNGCHFADNIFKCIFWNENVWISIKISLKFVPKGPVNNIPALVQIMAWHRPCDKPLSELMMVSLLRHIRVTLPQINELTVTLKSQYRVILSRNYIKCSIAESFCVCTQSMRDDVTM